MARSFVVLLLALAGCASSSTGWWQRAGADGDARSRDYAECREAARAAVQRDTSIDQDISASLGHDWQRTGTLRTRRDDMQESNVNRFGDLVGSCMKGRGYHLSGEAP